MAYTSLAQTTSGSPLEDFSLQKLTATTTPSPTIPELPIAPFSLDFGSTTDDALVHDRSTPDTQQDSTVSKLLSSLTGSTKPYELVEDDEYEEVDVTPIAESDKMATITGPRSPPVLGDKPVRTASISRQLPMNHPKPDLQSLQGAYVKNVERLEETAERLSMTSSLDGEIQRMKMFQRQKERTGSESSRGSQGIKLPQTASAPLSNSIIDVNAAARSGGYSPAGYITSPVGSIRSARTGPSGLPRAHFQKTARFSQAGHDLNLDSHSFGPELRLDFFQTPQIQETSPSMSESAANMSPGRPNSAGSGDTYQQAKSLFTDFDGVHYSAAAPSRRISLSRPPRARDSKAFREPQPGEEMIYYPAPVPVMLNLPVRLSKMNWNERDKRRLHALGEMPEDMRKSAPWLAHEDVGIPVNRQSMAKLPPQLRASAFFDQRGVDQNVQLKDGSAVATLDSILDAAAHAPVSAFTDHPIVGHLGKEVYGPSSSSRKHRVKSSKKKTKRNTSTTNQLAAKDSTTDLSAEGIRQSQVLLSAEPKEGIEEGGVSHLEDKSSGGSGSEGSESEDKSGSEPESDFEEDAHQPGFSAAPTTLLAELQMRKAQQKQRNRTAADAFPNGMHSTLLELDTVTQLQQKARKQKHITLAWEDREEADRENFDDDEVPLGVLFPEKDRKDHGNVNRPLGLMAKRELEENEPLSARRARLRGEPATAAPLPKSPAALSPADEVPQLEEPSLEEKAEETLAQRIKRLRELKENGSTSDFARDISSELGLAVEEPAATTAKTPEPDETLGQRRRRLKQEALKQGAAGDATGRPILKPSRSMADLLQRNPVGYVDPGELNTATTRIQSYQQQLSKNPAYLAQQQAAAAMMNPGYGHSGIPHVLTQGQYTGAYGYNPYGVPMVGSGTHHMMGGYPMQMPMNVNMNVPMGMSNMGHAYTVAGHVADPNALGFGPPLNDKQRAHIDQWRQGIA